MTPDEFEKRYRILDDKNQLVPADVEEWSRFFESPRRVVRLTLLNHRKGIRVSTVCLGIDHGYGRRPLWFETMIFGTSMNDYQERYETWEEALRGHAIAVGRARRARQTRSTNYGRRAWRKQMKEVRRMNRDFKRAERPPPKFTPIAEESSTARAPERSRS